MTIRTKILLISLFSLVIHLFPFFLTPHPLGYDTGFYRRYLIQPFISFPNPVVPGLGIDALIPRIIFDILRLTHIPTDFILYGSLISFFLVIPLLFYKLLSDTTNERTALTGSVLVIVSSVQYYSYWFMLWKNMWAICILLTIFILFNRKVSPFIIVILEIILALSHQTTTIIYIATLCVLILFERKRYKEIITHLLVTSTVFLLVSSHTHEIIKHISPIGVFLSTSQYITLSLPYFILGAFGIKKFYKEKNSFLMAFIIVSFLFPLLHLPFFERIFVFCDIGLVFIAAIGADILLTKISFENINRSGVVSFFIFILCIGLITGNMWSQMSGLRPLVTQDEIKKIEGLRDVVPPDATILTTSDEAPWFEGWTLFHIAAPGMLQDTHNLEQWTVFWSATSSTEKIAFLNDFQKPLYISTMEGAEDFIGTVPACVKKILPTLFKDECVNSK